MNKVPTEDQMAKALHFVSATRKLKIAKDDQTGVTLDKDEVEALVWNLQLLAQGVQDGK